MLHFTIFTVFHCIYSVSFYLQYFTVFTIFHCTLSWFECILLAVDSDMYNIHSQETPHIYLLMHTAQPTSQHRQLVYCAIAEVTAVGRRITTAGGRPEGASYKTEGKRSYTWSKGKGFNWYVVPLAHFQPLMYWLATSIKFFANSNTTQ